MGMLIEGLNLIRDLWSALNDKNELGTGTTQETAQDTGLESSSGDTSTTIITTTADQYVKKQACYYAYGASGSTVTELVWKTASNEVESSRVTFDGVVFNTDTMIYPRTRWYFRGRID